MIGRLLVYAAVIFVYFGLIPWCIWLMFDALKKCPPHSEVGGYCVLCGVEV